MVINNANLCGIDPGSLYFVQIVVFNPTFQKKIIRVQSVVILDMVMIHYIYHE